MIIKQSFTKNRRPQTSTLLDAFTLTMQTIVDGKVIHNIIRLFNPDVFVRRMLRDTFVKK